MDVYRDLKSASDDCNMTTKVVFLFSKNLNDPNFSFYKKDWISSLKV